MPDILIRGLCIPKEGFINLSVQSEGLTMLTATSTFNEKTGSYVWQKCDHVMYETVELPPHGDLIDRDKLEYHRAYFWHPDPELPDGGRFGGANAVVTSLEIKEAPVIVPASEEVRE